MKFFLFFHTIFRKTLKKFTVFVKFVQKFSEIFEVEDKQKLISVQSVEMSVFLSKNFIKICLRRQNRENFGRETHVF